MSRNSLLITLALSLILSAAAFAQGFGPDEGFGNGTCGFIDENGDGFNDLAPDADGDGIPNGLDADYVRPEDGAGTARMYGLSADRPNKSLDGEGEGWMYRYRFRYRHQVGEGPGDGEGNGPGDGEGNGPGGGEGNGSSHGPGPGEGNCIDTRNIGEMTRGSRGNRR